MSDRYARSKALLERARRVIPGGVWGHNRFPAFIDEGSYPYFAERAAGALFYDVDGNRFIDYMCAFGAMINGYANPIVDAAAAAQQAKGDCLNQPTEVTIELAERLCEQIDSAEWCLFAKNGSDATNLAFLIARAETSRQEMVCVRGSYHASHIWANWCNPGAGRPAADCRMVTQVSWNSVEELEAVFRQRGDSIAAVMLTPFHHPIPGPSVFPSKDFIDAIHACTQRWGARFILDDVRAGFRLDLRGSHTHVGFRPDLVCLSKALGNTHPIAAVLGGEAVRAPAESIFASGTFWNAAAAHAAALANLRLLGVDEAEPLRRMWRLGERLAAGITRVGAARGFDVQMSGPPTMPTMTLAGDVDFARMRVFGEAMAAAGSFVHPRHNWFISAAHTEQLIDETLEHAAIAFEALARVS